MGNFATSMTSCVTHPLVPAVDVDEAVAVFLEHGELPSTPEQDKNDIAVVKAANPGVALYGVLVDGRLYVFRPIKEEEYESGGLGDPAYMRKVLASCMLLPSVEEFETDLKHRCALRHVFMQHLLRIAGNDPRFGLVRL
jgi:hypothetical protein